MIPPAARHEMRTSRTNPLEFDEADRTVRRPQGGRQRRPVRCDEHELEFVTHHGVQSGVGEIGDDATQCAASALRHRITREAEELSGCPAQGRVDHHPGVEIDPDALIPPTTPTSSLNAIPV